MITVIAEAGINHCGSLHRALLMVEAAKEAGADVVKFQSFTATELGYDENLTKFLKSVELSEDDHYELKIKANDIGIEFMSTPFDKKWCNFLVDKIGVERIKISSGKAKHTSFVDHVMSFGVPIIASSGMLDGPSFLNTFRHCHNFTALYCVSNYPTPFYKVDFSKMYELGMSFNVGFSDHTIGIEASIIAAASGASVIEKHFTMDISLPGPDQICSLDPEQLKEMIRQIRLV